MEGSREPGELGDDAKAALHRQLFADGELTEAMMTGVALEALERADVDLFLDVTNVLRQSDDPEILDRTRQLLDKYADMAEGAPKQAGQDTVEEARRQIVEEFPESAVGYMAFLADEVEMSKDAVLWKVHHAAPEDLTPEQLETMAESLRQAGWDASVAPMRQDDEDAPLGIRVVDGN